VTAIYHTEKGVKTMYYTVKAIYLVPDPSGDDDREASGGGGAAKVRQECDKSVTGV
jgi:hypothetical protein